MPNSSIQYKYHTQKSLKKENIKKQYLFPLQALTPLKQGTYSILKEHIHI